MPKYSQTTLNQVLETIKLLTEKVDLLAQNVSKPPSVVTPDEPKIEEKREEIKQEETEYPIPSDYREIVNSILNEKFKIKLIPSKDSPTFSFSIFVPKEYSNALADHWKMYGVDERVKIISFADGVLGVKEWAEKVFNNFNQEVKALIVNDRNK